MSDKQSIWTLDTFLQFRPSLRGNYKADVAVIGGGMAGILTAYFLQQRGVDVVVLEAGRIGRGQTRNTTAKISCQHGLIYHRLLRDFGLELAQQYANAQQQAVELYRHMAGAGGIDCAFQDAPSYLYSTCRTTELERELRAAEKLWIPAGFMTSTELPFAVKGAVRFANQAQFQPLRFLQAIAKTLTIFENTMVRAVEGERIYTEGGIVQAGEIVIATHYPFVNVPGFYFLRMYQERSYVLALRHAQRLEGMYLGIDAQGYSLRGYGETVLLGGQGHRCGEHPAESCYESLRQAARQIYPSSVEIRGWSAQDCMTLDGVPYIGQYSAGTPGLYVATGFGKWGMTNSMVAAVLLSDSILGKANDCADIFSPQRFHLRATLRRVCRDRAHWLRGMTLGFVHVPKKHLEKVPNGQGAIVKYQGKTAGVYKNFKGETFVVSARCPHLGCRLNWNPDELSWDCPCHGSRFDYRGFLIDNPAMQGNGF